MRIMIGSESFYPNISGVAVTTWNLATYLAGQGHEVLVVVPSTSRSSYRESYEEGFYVHRIASIPHPLRRDLRVTTHPLRQIRAIVGSWQPEIIHLQDPTSIGSCLMKIARQSGIPVIISHHFTLEYILSYFRFLKPLQKRSQTFLTRSMRNFYNACEYVICPSETVKQWLLEVGVKVPVEVISNGVNLNQFFSYELPSGIRSDFELPELPIILYVGRIDIGKSLDTLLDAVPMVLENHRAHFVFCGGGNLLNRMRKKTEQQHLEPYVSFLGQLSHNDRDLSRLYQIAACFVIPSCCEAQSIVTMEAMASGLPIVAAAAGALPELVKDGDNGYLFEPENVEDLASKINLILEDRDLAHRMGQHSLEKVIEHEINRNLHKIENVYYEVLRHEKT